MPRPKSPRINITVSMDYESVATMDQFVADGKAPSRSAVFQEAINRFFDTSRPLPGRVGRVDREEEEYQRALKIVNEIESLGFTIRSHGAQIKEILSPLDFLWYCKNRGKCEVAADKRGDGT